VLGLGLGLVSGSSLVGVCRHLAAVVSVTYTTVVCTHDGRVYSGFVDVGLYTTVVSVVCRHDGRVRNINLFILVPQPLLVTSLRTTV